MRRTRLTQGLVLVVVLAAAAVLASCELPQSVCANEDLVAPLLVAPVNGSLVGDLAPSLSWTFPAECAPEGYRVDLSTTPDFSDAGIGGGTGNASTSWAPAQPLDVCIDHYWRVAAINGTHLGPFSETWQFKVDVTGGGCIEPPTGSIGGIVWHDLCAVPDGPMPPEPPPGCVLDGGLVANGILEPGEPGLAGVEVDLGAGACPASGLASALTDSDGDYSFGAIPAGTYCVSVNALTAPNDTVLIPGGWTWPTGSNGGTASAEVALAEGEALGDVNFGWDYQFLPAPPPPPSPVPSPTSPGTEILGFIWNDVCHFTGGVAGEPLVLGAGCIGDPAGVWGANGVLDAGETPFSGVTFRLAAGTCTAAPYASAASNVAGWFGFINVPPGTYCLTMDVLEPGNASILIPGGSTTHSMAGGKIQIPFTITPGQVQVDFAIGWEFQHLG
jgi:hypothetical protein